MYSKKYYSIILVYLCVINIGGCKKLVDVAPPDTQITSDNVYGNDATVIAALNGLYSKLSSNSFGSTVLISNISLWAGLSADEFSLWANTTSIPLRLYYQNALNASQPYGSEFWESTYPLIYTCNATIEGLNKSVSLTPAVKQQLLGEAKFMRAYFYFYLVNLYGDVPLVLTTNYTVNSLLSRSSKSTVYEQIILDLNDAKNLLADGYVKSDAMTLYPPGAAEKIRPSKAAASALFARVDLYINDWAKAESEATAVISNSLMYDTVALNQVFLKNSKEAILQLQPVTSGITNTQDGFFFNLTIAPTGINSTHPIFLSQLLLNSFEPGDKRRVNGNWISAFTDASGTYYFPYKYKVGSGTNPLVSEYPMFLRLGELYLIRSEARARQNNLTGAISDLDVIRNRAGLPLIAKTNPGISQTALLNIILHERQVELFSESGHRWLDLKRTGNVDEVMTTATNLKGGSWQSYQQIYPISGGDLLKNPNLTQNDKY